MRAKQLVKHIANDTETYREVLDTFCNSDGHPAHRSGFILGNVYRKRPELLMQGIGRLLEKMPHPPHQWYRWHVLWYLSHAKFEAEHDGLAATYAFEELGKAHNRPAVKNAAMRLLEFICKRNPELIPEYRLHLGEVIGNERPTLVCKAEGILKKFQVIS